MSSPYLAMDLDTLHRELEAHKATRPADPFGPEMATWMSTKDRILFALELKAGEAKAPPFHITVPPTPIEAPAPKPLPRAKSVPNPKEVRHASSPGKAGAPGAPLRGPGFSRKRPTTADLTPPEEPMPKPPQAASSASPEEQLDTLLAKLSNATAEASTTQDKSAFLKARGQVYQIRNEVAKLVKAHHLDEPSLPRIPANPWAVPRKGAKPPRLKTRKQDAPPQHLEAAPAPEAAVRPEPVVIDREGRTTPLSRLATLPPHQEQALPEAASRLRALRVQALEVLPLCEGLGREAAYAVRHQVDLLADVLAMADRLAREAS